MTTINTYYPNGINPIHAVESWSYVRRLIRAAKKGEHINPILVDVEGGNLLAGTHRWAANDIMTALGLDCLIDVVTLDDVNVTDELQAAIDNGDFAEIDAIWDEKR